MLSSRLWFASRFVATLVVPWLVATSRVPSGDPLRTYPILLFLALAWALWSGTLSLHHPQLPVLGALSCLSVAWLVRRMDRLAEDLPDGNVAPGFGLLTRVPAYLFFFLAKLTRSNIRVARLCLDPKMPMSPRLLRLRAAPRSSWAQVTLANSITLTPGTLTLDLRNGELLVHALGPISEESVINGEFNRAVVRLEGGTPGASSS